MQISVINLTTGPRQVTRVDAIAAIRAINRQLREDLFPYWHMHGSLRLDPDVGLAGDAERRHDALRGDGILYLMTSPDQGQMLGYHQRHHQGIPFGVVFTDVSAELGEAWSMTLSHEAIELLADPDVNLLCKGPHPDPEQAGRDVFHWFELCDAVQAEGYEIDGVTVSNFVLPAYFTSGEERAGHNDFLSTASAIAPPKLRSFGTNAGGYIGFYDPESRADVTHYDPRIEPGRNAAHRAEVKQRMASQARLRRKERRCSPAPSVEATPVIPAVPARPLAEGGPAFEALAFRVVPAPREDAAEIARGVVLELLGRDWETKPFWDLPGDFEARPAPSERATLDADKAWALTRRLRAHERVAQADPLFVVRPSTGEDAPDNQLRKSGRDDQPLPGAQRDCEWSVKLVRGREAWSLSPEARRYGRGILIGHPDTGYTEHPELVANLSLDNSIDFVDGGPALDSLETGFLIQPSHGTSTASVIASPDGSQRGTPEFVTGIAPAARIMPIRVSKSVVHLSTGAITKAIRHATRFGCHVISMSLGSPLGFGFLHDAVRDACNEGIIVLAAAGNEVGFVVYPAAFDEVIAVAACNVDLRPWSGSSRGSAVDISAPGESVWRARTRKSTTPPFSHDVLMGSGTSYAVATVAGIAALWLAHHGRQALIDRYGKGGVPVVFKQLLIASCQRPSKWDTGRYGAGIANAEALLQWPLPPAAPARGMRAVRGAIHPPLGESPLGKLQHLFEDSAPSALRSALCTLLEVSDRELDARLNLVGDELAMRLGVDARFRQDIARRIEQQGAAPGPASDPPVREPSHGRHRRSAVTSDG